MNITEQQKENTMKVFEMIREEDETGISGTGNLAYGLIFETGQAVLFWKSSKTINIYPDMATVEAIHGHGGKTKFIVRVV